MSIFTLYSAVMTASHFEQYFGLIDECRHCFSRLSFLNYIVFA